VAWARELAAVIAADSRFELCAPVPLSLICFRRKGTDEANRELLDKVNASGEVFLSHTALHGRFVLRLAIGNHATARAHVRRAWELVQAAV
jgi:aromatic-L-amino-acid decarboxylase